MKNDNPRVLIEQFIKEHNQMTIATSAEDPWIAVVYYSTDDDLSLYFLSDPNTIHGMHIAENPKVAVSIADSPQLPTSKKKCVQIFGLAEQISGERKVTHALNLWRSTMGIESDAYTYAGMMKKLISGRMYKVQIKRMKFFNQELWEEGDEPLLEL